ncbi:hypothetical protein [Vibrio crassostreae]|uniref:hypothetical protein n=1 Tax=Vibrio crassostreae TaxID=246167 RepID=UPI001B3060A1|nr:hypothetical protein [Vibrio crassostreae]
MTINNEKLKSLLSQSWHSTEGWTNNYANEVVKCSIGEAFISTAFRKGFNTLTLTKNKDRVYLTKSISGFVDVETCEVDFDEVKTFLSEGNSIIDSGIKYEVKIESNIISIASTSYNIDLELCAPPIEKIKAASGRGTGVLVVCGNTRSNLNNVFNFVSEVALSQHTGVGKLDLYNSDNGHLQFGGNEVQIDRLTLVDTCKRLGVKALKVDATSDRKMIETALELSESGLLIVVMVNGQSSVHEYNNLCNSVDSTLLSSSLIGVVGVATVPEVEHITLKSNPFNKDKRYDYFKKFDSSPMPKEPVFNYNSTEYNPEKVIGTIDLIDFIPLADDIVDMRDSKFSVYDQYSKLKMQAWEGTLDYALQLLRMKKTALDLIELHVSKY